MFAERVRERSLTLNTRLCLGLDPRAEYYGQLDLLRSHTLEVLEAVAPLVACVKPQVAFFEALGLSGMRLLGEVCVYAHALDLPVIIDAKRGDIGSTAEAYATAWLTSQHRGSALTINPFLGWETLAPFVHTAREYHGGTFVLVKTSNSGSQDLQDLKLADGRTISEVVASEVARLGEEESGDLSSVGAVVGATHAGELARFRQLMPKATLLLPGLGAQGAQPRDLAPAFLEGGIGAIASASRGIQYADGIRVDAAIQAAQDFRDAINEALHLS
jgi:orotidine-5'-phosphate decarboxylase